MYLFIPPEYCARLWRIAPLWDSISAQVAAALAPQLTGDEQRSIKKHYTDNIEAYQLYLRGRVEWYKFSPDGVERSISYYNQAIALDPSYALAYAGLSFSYSVQAAIGALPPLEVFPKSEKAAETALKLDDTLSEAHVAFGGKSLFFERDWSNAEREFRRAIELNPNQSDAHQLLGYCFEIIGQYDKAEGEIKTAQKIAPLTGLLNADVAALPYYQHRYDEAINLYLKTRHLDPDFIPAPFILAQAYERKGLYGQAINECRKKLASSPDNPLVLPVLGYAYASAGRKNEAQVILNKLQGMRQQRYISPFMIALLCTGMDKKDEAIKWLNEAYEERDPQIIWINIEPELDPLHSDTCFIQLIQLMNLTP